MTKSLKMNNPKKNIPKNRPRLKEQILFFLPKLFRESVLNACRHIGLYIPKLAFTHMPVHNPQHSPDNFRRVQIRIELKLLMHSSCKFLFFIFLRLIQGCPVVIINSFYQKRQLCS